MAGMMKDELVKQYRFTWSGIVSVLLVKGYGIEEGNIKIAVRT